MKRAVPVAVLSLVLAVLALSGQAATAAPSSSVNLNVHVHDDFYHPAGAFVVGPGTDHNLAMAACQVASPDPLCDAHIFTGDTITWVSPAPLAANPHTVTECTNNTFSVCGPAVSINNPIGDSGVRPPPNPGPGGWPYGPILFNVPGTYYYRCEVHPATMRGRIVVALSGVGGDVNLSVGGSDGFGAWSLVLIAAGAVALAAAGAAGWYATKRIRR